MLWRRCKGLVLQAATRYRPLQGGEHPTRPVGYVGVLCAECGALLLPEEMAGQLIEKVAQLAQFGLVAGRSEEHTSELQSRLHLVCRLLLEKKKKKKQQKKKTT